MPHCGTDDGVKLFYEEVGTGDPLVLVHEFAGDYRSYEFQVRYFSRSFRAITFNARGYPPSDVPPDPGRYSQERAAEDIHAVLKHLRIDKAHILGVSMGAFAALQFGLTYPARTHSLVLTGVGYGADPRSQETIRADLEDAAARIRDSGMEAFADTYAVGPARIQFKNKDPKGWAEFKQRLAQHSGLGSANTLLGVQRRRPSLYSLAERLQQLDRPVLVVCGDEDGPCLEPSIFLKQTIPTAALAVVPATGHTVNLEEPCAFNALVGDFLARVRAGNRFARDPRSVSPRTMG